VDKLIDSINLGGDVSMSELSFKSNERENILKEFYRSSGFLINYLCNKEKLFKRTEEYYFLKGAGAYPVDLKKITSIYCRILEWTNLLSLKDEKVRQALKVMFSAVKHNISNPTPEEYIREYMTVYTISSAIGAA
jgi:hypothetical protein